MTTGVKIFLYYEILSVHRHADIGTVTTDVWHKASLG